MKNSQTFSTRSSKALFWVGLCVLTLLAALLSIWFGSVGLTPIEVLEALFSDDMTSTSVRIVRYSRLPRTCASMLAGAGLAVAIVCAVAPAAQQYTPVVAFMGALAGVLLVMGLSQSTGASRMTVVLAGVAISNLFSAGIDAVITLVPDALNGVTDFRIGGFTGVTMTQLKPAAIMIFVSLIIVISLSQQLDILSLGTDVAQSLGLATGPVRFILLVLAAALAGAAVSFSGLLSFVGLIVPHAMRRIVGEESFSLLVSSALGGAFFVTVCDLLARVLFAPFELPVGIVLAFTGAPFFLWLLFKQKGGRG